MNLDLLNAKQKEAVLITEGPLLIIAGAGSGKTKVLTEKIIYLIEENNVFPDEILAITFTNKATKEMKDRVLNKIGKKAYYIWISTFHSFGLKIIRENYSSLDLDKNFTIIDSDDSLMIIKKIMKDMNLDPKYYSPKMIKNKISSAKNEDIDEEEYEKYVNIAFEEIMLKIYRRYQKELKKNNSVDFDDLLILPIKLFRDYPEVLRRYQEQYKYVFIDEYQDTNKVQYILSKMISAKYKNICVVGDESQAIYGWRGADYKNILNFEKDYPNCKVVVLEQNYRSNQTILNASNDVIKNNKERKDKNLWSENEVGSKIKYYRSYDERNEIDYVIEEIKKLKKEGLDYNEMVVLYRTNAQSRIVEEEMGRKGIPYRIVGSYYFFDRKEIKDLISYLKLLYNPKDDTALIRVINSPKRGIGDKTVDNLRLKANLENKSIYEIINDGKELKFKQLIDSLREGMDDKKTSDLIDEVIKNTGLKEELMAIDNKIISESKLQNLEEFKTIAIQFEERTGLVLLSDFLNEVTLVSDMSEHKNEVNAVTIMTVHSVKGLEFDAVFVIGLEEGIFPHINSIDEIEEERRLCYVAMTRARKYLYLINARRRMLYGKDQINPPSRFISEINDEYIENGGVKEEKKIDKKSKYHEDADIDISDHVYHDTYGEGVIISIDGIIATIAFSHKYGIKKMMKNHKSLKKL